MPRDGWYACLVAVYGIIITGLPSHAHHTEIYTNLLEYFLDFIRYCTVLEVPKYCEVNKRGGQLVVEPQCLQSMSNFSPTGFTNSPPCAYFNTAEYGVVALIAQAPGTVHKSICLVSVLSIGDTKLRQSLEYIMI